jgi:hypothetical protein
MWLEKISIYTIIPSKSIQRMLESHRYVQHC